MTEWSPLLTVETDTADSSHRITFDQIECFEVLGEGGFSVVHRGRYKGQVCFQFEPRRALLAKLALRRLDFTRGDEHDASVFGSLLSSGPCLVVK